MMRILLPLEVGQAALDAMHARLLAHLYGRAKILGIGVQAAESLADAGNPLPSKPALSLEDGDECPNCLGLLMEDRVIIDHMAGIVRPCHVCRPADFAKVMARQAADPWELASEELCMTAPLPREVPQYYGRDRAGYDERDDLADIQPFERTTK